MTQRKLCEAVSKTTGESVRAIRQRGFSLVSSPPNRADEETPVDPQMVDWDRLELDRIDYAVQA